jgi:WD40 repeat protein
VPFSEDDVAKQPFAGKINWRRGIVFFLAFAQALLVTTGATATTIDMSPHRTLVLPGSQQFLVRDAWNGVALYRLSDRSVVHRFRGPSEVSAFAASSDEKMVILACDNGALSAFDLASGERLWKQSPLSSVSKVGFSSDGQSILVDGLLVLEAATGRKIGTLPPLPDKSLTVWSAALGPGGTRGSLVAGYDGQLYTFDVQTGQVAEKGVKKLGPVRQAVYSVDGKYLALRCAVFIDGWPYDDDQLRIVNTADAWTVQDVGVPTQVGHMKPTADGGFLLTGLDVRINPLGAVTAADSVGLRWRPGAKDLEELYRLPSKYLEPDKMDFDPEQLVGVRTNWRLITEVVDLRTGTVLGSINNSANYRARITTSYSPGILGLVRHWLGWDAESSWTPAFRCAVVLGGAAALWLVIRRRRIGKGAR